MKRRTLSTGPVKRYSTKGYFIWQREAAIRSIYFNCCHQRYAGQIDIKPCYGFDVFLPYFMEQNNFLTCIVMDFTYWTFWITISMLCKALLYFETRSMSSRHGNRTNWNVSYLLVFFCPWTKGIFPRWNKLWRWEVDYVLEHKRKKIREYHQTLWVNLNCTNE